MKKNMEEYVYIDAISSVLENEQKKVQLLTNRTEQQEVRIAELEKKVKILIIIITLLMLIIIITLMVVIF